MCPLAAAPAMLRAWNLNKKQTYNGPLDGFTVTGFMGTPKMNSFKLRVEIASNSAKKEFKCDYLDHRPESKPTVEAAILTYLASTEFRDSKSNTLDVRISYERFINLLYNR